MARNENPPFGRGLTWFDPDHTISSDDVTATNYLLGKSWVFEDEDFTDATNHTVRSGNEVHCRLVRNIADMALLPKRLVTFSDPATSGYTQYGNEVDGYADTTIEKAYPVDEWLPSTGVKDDDLFYVVVQGPATILTTLAALGADIVVGANLAALTTSATTGSTTAGRITNADFTGATAVLGNNIEGRIGRAMSAKTTGNTNADLLVFVGEF